MKYALIGCGRIAVNHIKAVLNNQLELVAVCDILPEKMEALLAKYDLQNDASIARYTDYKKLLSEHPELQLISIATESGLHAEIALEAGRFGRLSHGSIHVRWNRDHSYYDQASWRGTWAQDGGCLMNQCIHGIDLLRWMLGDEVDEVYGATRRQFHDYLEAEDVGLAVVKFKNGAIGTIEGTTNVYPKNLEETLYVFGEKGTVKLGGTSTNNIDVWNFADESDADAKNKGLQEATSNVYGNGHTSLFADMVDAIEHDRKPYVDAVAGRNALEMVLAIYKSQKTGLPVKLPLTDFASTDMTGEF